MVACWSDEDDQHDIHANGRSCPRAAVAAIAAREVEASDNGMFNSAAAAQGSFAIGGPFDPDSPLLAHRDPREYATHPTDNLPTATSCPQLDAQPQGDAISAAVLRGATMQHSRATGRSKAAPRHLAAFSATASSDDSGSDDLDGGPIEISQVVTPDGSIVEVKYRGVDPDLVPGSAEWKKAKRLADNRASAARSRALQRLKAADSSVSRLRAWFSSTSMALARWAGRGSRPLGAGHA